MDYSWIGITRAHMSDDTMMRSNALLNRWSSKQHKSGNMPGSPWIHPPGALQGAHVAYLVKFLGCTEVESAKGLEVVKAGIQKMRFSSHLKRSEGSKIPKMELTISIDGVAIQEPKTKRILYQYPLYRISYCADDKAEKRFFCFIAKEENPSTEQTQHRCFVFVSDRLAENITLTIGQAFDLAYRRFLETSGREMEMRKQILILQKRARLLERENADLKQRIAQLEPSGLHTIMVDGVDVIKLSDASESTVTTVPLVHSTSVNGYMNGTGGSLLANGVNSTNDPQCNRGGFGQNTSYASAPTLAVRQQHRVEIAPPPPLPPRPLNGTEATNGHSDGKSDLITLDPFAVTISPEEDPFGDFQKLFATNSASSGGSDKLYDEAIGRMDKRMSEMKEGFSRGLTLGRDDFSLDAFDPLSKNRSTSHA
ncbi:PTB domain-containing engulfment adapter protein 1-like isoform X2 [Paramacrobiotus metropolitanus]|uniref:PTB domain-containing engulfment adapter protein 1-like isoform X2 n=1 Tax=Paramacrobiotus metropolitanus TaxID=2943436 RepID=UPI002445FE6A|nr:PTB domain-containing engulfment adapter protein 1-like isoform X2 [Paramacrobiotus metropolitanus]